MSDKRLTQLIQSFPELKVLVIGEAMLDAYLEGTTERLCREAPVPVVDVQRYEHVPGGAANTAVNVHDLGAQVAFLSVVGDDSEGDQLLSALEQRGISTDSIVREKGRVTLSKSRVLAGPQMVVRFDKGSTHPLQSTTQKALSEKIKKLFNWSDAVIISDYCYGILNPRQIKTIAKLQAANPRVVVVDSKCLSKYQELDITAVKPNYDEVIQLLGNESKKELASRVDEICANQKHIFDLTRAQIVAVTLDMEGALVFERDRDPYRTYAVPVPNSYAAGAGDTFVSGLALALAAGAHTPAAAEIASAAASIVVHKEGTASCFSEELLDHFSTEEKIVTDAFQVAARMAYYRRLNKRIVFTNGCFDILHRGHITYLNKAKEYGDILVVGLNSDSSVRRLKGENRPINSQEDRSQVLSALSCVDHIIPFDEDTPVDIIKLIEPDIFVKGGDYTRQTLPEAPVVEQLGGEVVILPYVQDHSTTGIIDKIRQIYALEASSKKEADAQKAIPAQREAGSGLTPARTSTVKKVRKTTSNPTTTSRRGSK